MVYRVLNAQSEALLREPISHLVMSNSLLPEGLEPVGLLCPWDSPGKNTGVSYHALLQGSFPTQR